jgi:hypothetical protein
VEPMAGEKNCALCSICDKNQFLCTATDGDGMKVASSSALLRQPHNEQLLSYKVEFISVRPTSGEREGHENTDRANFPERKKTKAIE